MGWCTIVLFCRFVQLTSRGWLTGVIAGVCARANVSSRKFALSTTLVGILHGKFIHSILSVEVYMITLLSVQFLSVEVYPVNLSFLLLPVQLRLKTPMPIVLCRIMFLYERFDTHLKSSLLKYPIVVHEFLVYLKQDTGMTNWLFMTLRLYMTLPCEWCSTARGRSQFRGHGRCCRLVRATDEALHEACCRQLYALLIMACFFVHDAL